MTKVPFIRSNPLGAPPPVGNYSHVTIVPANTEWYVLSGQVGVQSDGTFSPSFNDQATMTFTNISKVLESQGLGFENVIKVNIWATEEIDWKHFYKEWENFFGSVYPSMTVVYITALGFPEIKLEIEIWAGK